MSVDEVFPVGTLAHELQAIFGLHQAAIETSRIAHTPQPALSPTQLEQRKGILLLSMKLILQRRDALLDEFCRSWLRHRNLPIPAYEPTKEAG